MQATACSQQKKCASAHFLLLTTVPVHMLNSLKVNFFRKCSLFNVKSQNDLSCVLAQKSLPDFLSSVFLRNLDAELGRNDSL